MRRFLKFNYLLGCSNSVAGAKAENDSDTKDGILVNHAYSILYCKEVGKLQLLKLRSPWGFAEWDGDWSDKSEKWEENPAVLSALQNDPSARLRVTLTLARSPRFPNRRNMYTGFFFH